MMILPEEVVAQSGANLCTLVTHSAGRLKEPLQTGNCSSSVNPNKMVHPYLDWALRTLPNTTDPIGPVLSGSTSSRPGLGFRAGGSNEISQNSSSPPTMVTNSPPTIALQPIGLEGSGSPFVAIIFILVAHFNTWKPGFCQIKPILSRYFKSDRFFQPHCQTKPQQSQGKQGAEE